MPLDQALQDAIREAKEANNPVRWRALLTRYGLQERLDAGEGLYPIPAIVSFSPIAVSSSPIVYGGGAYRPWSMAEYSAAFDGKTVGILKHVNDSKGVAGYRIYLQAGTKTSHTATVQLDDLFLVLWKRLFQEEDFSRTLQWELRRYGSPALIVPRLEKDVHTTWYAAQGKGS